MQDWAFVKSLDEGQRRQAIVAADKRATTI
jgi:hypothetical protein